MQRIITIVTKSDFRDPKLEYKAVVDVDYRIIGRNVASFNKAAFRYLCLKKDQTLVHTTSVRL